MPNFKVRTTVRMRGTLFDAGASRALVTEAMRRIREALSEEGVKRVHTRLGQVLQNPTGFYESKVVVDRRTPFLGVWDSFVIYGPWLEGTSSRNASTRFKGYRTFRLVGQQLSNDTEAIAEPIVTRLAQELRS